MHMILSHVWLGDDRDGRILVEDNLTVPTILFPDPVWAVVHAAKDPWHREMVGYTSRAAPADHPERWTARKGNRLALNLVDMPQQDPALILPILTTASEFISSALSHQRAVLVHCNQGQSRAPSVILAWLLTQLPTLTWPEATALIPHPLPDTGIVALVHSLYLKGDA